MKSLLRYLDIYLYDIKMTINEREKRMAEAIIYLKNKKRQKQQKDNA